MSTLNQTLIGKAVAYAAKTGGGTIANSNELDLLAPGAIAIFTADNVLVTGATVPATIANRKQFYFAVGYAGGTKLSIPIDRDAFHRAYCTYVAPVKNVKCIGASTATGTGASNLPATPVAGTIASFWVDVRMAGTEEATPDRERYEYVVKTGDTPLIILNALIAKVNATVNGSLLAVATLDATNDGIILTAKEFDWVLDIGTDDILLQATRQQVTPVNFGRGTYDQILALENETRINDGMTSPTWFTRQYDRMAVESVAGTNYDTFNFTFGTERRDAISSQHVAIPTVTVAVPNGSAVATSLNTIITTIILDSIPSTGNGGSNSPL